MTGWISRGTGEKVKSDALDTTAGFLDAKVDSATIRVDGTNHWIEIVPGVFVLLNGATGGQVIRGGIGTGQNLDLTGNGVAGLGGAQVNMGKKSGGGWLLQAQENNQRLQAGVTLRMGNNKIEQLLDPTGVLDAVNKQYVDNNFSTLTARRSLTFSTDPLVNGPIEILGVTEILNAPTLLNNATPLTCGSPGYHAHLIATITAITGSPFNLTVTGTSIDETTGNLTPGDTELVNVASPGGSYQTIKSWIDAPVLTVPVGVSCTCDVKRVSYWDRGNLNFKVTGCRFEFKPGSPAWSITFSIYKATGGGGLQTIDTKTFTNLDTPPRAVNGKSGKYKRGDYNASINGTGLEGIIVEMNTTNIDHIFFEVKYHDE